MKTSQIAQILTLSLTLVLMTACGSSKSAEVYSDSFSSRSSGSGTTSGKTATDCNLRTSNGFIVKLKSVIDSTTRNARPDLTHLQILDVPAELATSGNYLAFHKWFATSGAAPAIDNAALEFAVIDSQTGATLTSGKTVFKWSDFSITASAWGVNNPKDFFKRAQIVVNLKDYNASYDALKITIYNVSNQATVSADALLTPFAVNPRDYAVESSGLARPTVLKALHPFASNTTRSTAEYQASATNFCF